MLAKSKLNSIEVLISQALIDSDISHDEFVLNNMLKEYNSMIEEIKNLKRLNLSFRQLCKNSINNLGYL